MRGIELYLGGRGRRLCSCGWYGLMVPIAVGCVYIWLSSLFFAFAFARLVWLLYCVRFT